MPDLEKQITEWRRQMLTAGIKTPVPLEELESHLREDIERQMRSGLNAQDAFNVAIRQLGQAAMLQKEFQKNESKIMKKRIIIGVGVICLFLGTTMILPALGKHKQRNQAALASGATFFTTGWAGDEVYGLVLGTALAIGGASVGLFGFKTRKA